MIQKRVFSLGDFAIFNKKDKDSPNYTAIGAGASALGSGGLALSSDTVRNKIGQGVNKAKSGLERGKQLLKNSSSKKDILNYVRGAGLGSGLGYRIGVATGQQIQKNKTEPKIPDSSEMKSPVKLDFEVEDLNKQKLFETLADVADTAK